MNTILAHGVGKKQGYTVGMEMGVVVMVEEYTLQAQIMGSSTLGRLGTFFISAGRQNSAAAIVGKPVLMGRHSTKIARSNNFTVETSVDL